jgi:glycosyltransferase involved in cell wall biosynthesis
MKECLESMIAKYRLNDCFSLNGPINIYDLSKYLKAVDYIVIPSRIDSIPVILSDALQKKCPIIATKVGDMGR